MFTSTPRALWALFAISLLAACDESSVAPDAGADVIDASRPAELSDAAASARDAELSVDAAPAGDAAHTTDGGASDAGVDCRRARDLVARCCGPDSSTRATCSTSTGVWSCSDPSASVFQMEPWQSCGPNRVDPARDVEEGVPCSLSTGGSGFICPLGSECVHSITTSCELSPSGRSHYRLATCDGPEDCGGARCCLTDERESRGVFSARDALYRTDCSESCDAFDDQLCNADSDCEGGEVCCAGPALFGRIAGLCQPSCFE